VRNVKWCFSPHCSDNSHSMVTKIDKVGGMDDVIKCAKFGVDQMIGVGCAGSVFPPVKRSMTYSHLPSTTMETCDDCESMQNLHIYPQKCCCVL
jgi:hypothetical protein